MRSRLGCHFGLQVSSRGRKTGLEAVGVAELVSLMEDLGEDSGLYVVARRRGVVFVGSERIET